MSLRKTCFHNMDIFSEVATAQSKKSPKNLVSSRRCPRQIKPRFLLLLLLLLLLSALLLLLLLLLLLIQLPLLLQLLLLLANNFCASVI